MPSRFAADLLASPGKSAGSGMRVTAIQTSSIDDKAANLAAVRDLIATAVAADRPDLVLLPGVGLPGQDGSDQARGG